MSDNGNQQDESELGASMFRVIPLRRLSQTSEREHLRGSMRRREPIFGVVVTNSLPKLRLNVKCLLTRMTTGPIAEVWTD